MHIELVYVFILILNMKCDGKKTKITKEYNLTGATGVYT